jgi:hypothetical protein
MNPRDRHRGQDEQGESERQPHCPQSAGTSHASYGRQLYPCRSAAASAKEYGGNAKYRDGFGATDVIRVMPVPNSPSLPGSPG